MATPFKTKIKCVSTSEPASHSDKNSRWKHRSWKNITTPQSGMSGTSSLHSPSPIFQKLDTSSNCDRDYPTYWSVKDFTTYNAGGYGKIVGNPTLKPSRDLSLSLTYILHSRYVASLFFNNSKDEFRQLPYQSDEKKEMEYKHVNFEHVNQVGLMLTVPINIGNWWQNRLTFTGVYQNDKNSSPVERHFSLWQACASQPRCFRPYRRHPRNHRHPSLRLSQRCPHLEASQG